MRRVEREDEGALVVEDAASEQVALASRDVERVDGPAEAERNDVGVGDRGDVALRLAREVGVAEVAVEVVRVEAETAGDGEGAGERLVRSGAPGLARLGMVEVLDRLDLHERADVGDHVLPDLVDVLVNLCLELLVRHDGLPAYDACGNAFHGSRGGRAILAEAGPLSVCGPSRA